MKAIVIFKFGYFFEDINLAEINKLKKQVKKEGDELEIIEVVNHSSSGKRK